MSAKDEALLELSKLSVSFATDDGIVQAVDGIDLSLQRGRTLGVVGESGCGKSVTSLAIMGLLPPENSMVGGEVRFEGRNLLKAPSGEMRDLRGRRLAMIFQEPMTSLNPAYTIGNQLEEAMLRHKPVSRKEARDRAVHLLGRVGITAAEQRLRQYPHQLSGGLRQRVMIAMALMCGPALIVADEPTTALDVTIQAQILHLLAELQREFHMGLVLITHDLGIVARIATRVVVMYAGEVVETGPVDEIFRAPRHPYTQGLLACIPVPGKTRRGEQLGVIPGMVPSLIGDMPYCHFASRCPIVIDQCRAAPVPLTAEGGRGRQVRCIRAADVAAGALQAAETAA